MLSSSWFDLWYEERVEASDSSGYVFKYLNSGARVVGLSGELNTKRWGRV